MVVITLIGEHQAIEGMEFVYCGPLTECRECRLKAVCFNLDVGGLYRIKKAREVHHDCRIHEEGVRVVEVDKMPLRSAVPSKYAIEGSTITMEEMKCKNLGCVKYRICHPANVEKNTKRRIIAVSEDISCPEGLKIVEVTLE